MRSSRPNPNPSFDPIPVEPSGRPGDGCRLVSRRQFIAGLGATVTLAACGSQTLTVYQRSPVPTASLGRATATPLAAAPPGTLPRTDRTLVVVELGGGNDALSTVVPLTGRYRDLRPTTAVEDPIELDREIGLHPALTTIAERFRAGEVAVMEGLGVAKADLSHFISMRRWWDGTDTPDQTGWLGRYLDATVGYDEVLAGISVGPAPSPAMLGAASYVVGISDAAGLASGFPWWVDDERDFAGVWSGFAPADVPVATLDPVHRAIAAASAAQMRLQGSLAPLQAALAATEVESSSLEGQLALAGALVASPIRPPLIFVHGNVDFDTHEDQLGRHGEMMAQLDRGLRRFFEFVDSAGVSDRVVMMTTSEFGRRAHDNDGGTDHGTAASHFLIGASVAGGRYGESPSLTRFDADDNLVHTVDFRSVYASVLDDWLGTDHETILRGRFETLPLFRAGRT